jgi:hypothetical protein
VARWMFLSAVADSAAAFASRRLDSALAARRYWGVAKGVSGASGFLSGLLAIPWPPLGEGGHVDLGLAVGQVRPAGRLHPGGVGPAERLGLLAGPAAGLVAAPGPASQMRMCRAFDFGSA